MQTCLEEKHEKRFLLCLDLEKPFDRVSHEYLMEALSQGCRAGVANLMRLWISIIYSAQDSMRRRGCLLTDSSPENSDSDQGRSSTRIPTTPPPIPVRGGGTLQKNYRQITNDANLEGIYLDKRIDIMSQFAHDTVIMLRDMRGIDFLFDAILPRYETANGMRVNAGKTEGLLLGAQRRCSNPSR